MTDRRRVLAAMAAAAWLGAGCAVAPRAPADPGSFSGRMSVRVDADPVRSFASAFELSGDPRQGRITLTSPLGTVLAEIQWSPQGAVLTASDGRTTEAPQVDDLAAQALGERIPVGALFHWLRGQPWPLAGHRVANDGLAGFDQLGWRVDLSGLGGGRVEARRAAEPVVSVRVLLDRP